MRGAELRADTPEFHMLLKWYEKCHSLTSIIPLYHLIPFQWLLRKQPTSIGIHDVPGSGWGRPVFFLKTYKAHQRQISSINHSWKRTWTAADVLCPHLGFNLRPETVTPTTWQFQLPCDQTWRWNIRQRKMELGEETSNNKFWIFQIFRFWFQLNIAKFESWTSDPRKKGWWSYPICNPWCCYIYLQNRVIDVVQMLGFIFQHHGLHMGMMMIFPVVF